MESIEVGTESNDGDTESNALASELNVTVHDFKHSHKKQSVSKH